MVQKKCRICGKMYTPCSYCEGDKMAFHYRTICCSKECAKVYLSNVLKARGKTEDIPKVEPDIVHESQEELSVNKPKYKYTRKTKKENESESSEQIE